MKQGIAGCLLLCAGLVGCAETTGPELRPDGFDFSTPAGFLAAVDSTYAALHGFWGLDPTTWLAQPGTDTWTYGDVVAPGTPATDELIGQYILGSESPPSMAVWSALYDIVGRANTVLDHAGMVRGLQPSGRNLLVGEVRFLRALAYFQLVQSWGDVTLNLSARDAARSPTRVPAGQVYDAIIADLDTASAYLPAHAARGRASEGAAQHLLASVYLTRAYKSYGAGQADFARALALADSVIDSGIYALVPVYADLWCAPHRPAVPSDPNRQSFCDLTGWNEQNAEVIFPIVFSLAEGQMNMLSGTYLSAYTLHAVAGLMRDLDDGVSLVHLRPLPYGLALFDQVRWMGAPGASDIRDTRFAGSYQTLWFADTAGTAGNATGPCPACTSGAPIAVGDTALWMPGCAVTDGDRQAHPYVIAVPCPDTQGCAPYGWSYGNDLFPSLKKYQDNLRANSLSLAGGKDIYLMRLGETYLLAAEAAVGLGARDRAAAYVNVLRRRAASPAHEADNDVAAAAMTLDFVMDERERELSGEVSRWHDLVRPGPDFFVRRVQAHNPDAAANVDAHFALRPIPQEQIDSAKAAGGTYPQNPGY